MDLNLSSFFASVKRAAFRTKLSLFEEARGQLYIDIGNNCGDAVFVAGSGRGGTTWIAELINFDNSYRLIFEPMNRLRVPLSKPFSDGLYIRPDDNDPNLLEPIRTILSGRLRNKWSDRFNRQPFPRKRLIKDNTANLWLRWLYAHFPEVPIVLVVRHPGAVVCSRIMNQWRHDLQTYLSQPALMTDFLSPFKSELEKATTPFEMLLQRWCVETYVPLKQFAPGQIHVTFYENFCLQPQLEIVRLFGYLGRRWDYRVLRGLHRPSITTEVRGRKLPSRSELINGWRSVLTANQILRVQNAMKLFGLDALYDEDGLPRADAALSLVTAQQRADLSRQDATK
jgi:hypothetical protein